VAVSQYEKNRQFERAERRSGGKDLGLPARSRSRLPKNLFGEQVGEGRAVTFRRSDSGVPNV
jgi:hypothetical protein